MLRIVVEGEELFDEATNSFTQVDDVVLDLEHSLLSLSKWESKFNKPFLSGGVKTTDEILGYIHAMILTPNQDLDVVQRCGPKVIEEIQKYIDSSQSATTFGAMPERRGSGEIITSELIYFWMISFQIPFECEKWHLNRLFSLIRICNIKNGKPTKQSRAEMAKHREELNAKRKAELGTSG